jgi:hypothetical protein
VVEVDFQPGHRAQVLVPQELALLQVPVLGLELVPEQVLQ